MAPVQRPVSFYRPGRSFPSVSVTGSECALGCDYCQGRYLEAMRPVSDPDGLVGFALELEASGGKGLLLSGGCDLRGRIPWSGFLGAVREIKSRTSLLVNLHTGLLDREEEARALVESGADCFSVDVAQDQALIRQVMHLERGRDDYERTLRLLLQAGAGRVVPHICLGLSSDQEGEVQAIRLAAGLPVSALVLLSFLPARGTPMARSPPAPDERVLGAVALAVAKAKAPVIMGCMRPRGNWRLEVECLRAGASGMAMPDRRTVEWAEANAGVEWREVCCALHR